MPLSPGTRLGPYEILAPLGAGGMGEVYRARDIRLDRTVAIKVLPSHLSSNPERRQRFEREAKAISSLNHPHICTLYDIGHHEGVDFLVMEHLEGETLEERLKKGALPLDQVLGYAVEVADALDKAHRQGLTHRDLKPGNIMLTRSGAKLLDFGLAKPAATPGSALTAMATGSQPLTTEGTIVGTFQYMAPEQLERNEVDARTDIFAFGTVLYEMATGKKAFEGKTQASVIAAILERDPTPITALQPMTPEALNRVIKKCLAKDPDNRWQTASDLRDELKWIAEIGSGAAVSPPPLTARRKTRQRIWAATTFLLFLAVVALTVLVLHRSEPNGRVVRFVIPPPEKSTITGSMAISPDGSRIAFVAADFSGKDHLWVQSMDSLSALQLPESDDASFPFWSPDSRYVGFFAESNLKTIAISGGPPHSLCDVSDARGGTWNRSGVILFAPNSGSGLYRIPATGGSMTAVTTRDESQETSHRWPVFLPDGYHFIYFIQAGKADVAGIYLGSLDSKEKKRLLSGHLYAAFAAPGYLLFARERTLMAQPFDTRRLQLTGDAAPIAESIWSSPVVNGLAAFSVSENGVLAYRSGSAATNRLLWFDRSGKQSGSLGSPGTYDQPALSPDGKRLAVDEGSNIWLIDSSTQTSSRLTFGSGQTATWSPDGGRVIFNSNRQGTDDLYQKLSNNAGNEELVLRSNFSKYPDDWSADGRFVVFDNVDPKTRFDLWVLPMFGDRKPRPFLQTQFNETQGHVSPNGRWLAYASDETGRYEVYVTGFPSVSGKWQVSSSGGAQPSWRRDGKELFYIAADKKLMAVEVKEDSSTFRAGVPVPLFQTHVRGLTDSRNYYAARGEGKRFLVITPRQEDVSSPINVVLNWTRDLHR